MQCGPSALHTMHGTQLAGPTTGVHPGRAAGPRPQGRLSVPQKLLGASAVSMGKERL